MSNLILHKRSSIPGGKPTLSLPLGELAVNTADGVLFTKKNAGSDVMVEFNGSETPHLFRHQGAVSNPAAGYVKLYPKSDNNFYKRTSAGAEARLWDSGNHGDGSGLDADLLDGNHATAFALTDHTHTDYVLKAGDTMTGDLNIAKTVNKTYFRVQHNVDANVGIQGSMESFSQVTGAATFSLSLLTKFGSVSTPNNLVTAFQSTSGEISVYFGNIGIRNHIACDYGTFANSLYVFCTSAADHQVWKVPISSFGGGGSGVSSFNGRIGAVTLLKADVEDVLTGDITTHTHKFAGLFSDSYVGSGSFIQMTSSQVQYVFNGGGIGSTPYWALPALSTNSNRMYFVKNAGGRAMIVSTIGSDKMIIANNVEVTEVQLEIGEWCVFNSASTAKWYAYKFSASSGGGGGTVTSVGVSVPSALFGVTGSPVTGAGTISISLNGQAQNSVFAGPAAASGYPTFRALVANDIPNLASLYDKYVGFDFGVNDLENQMVGRNGTYVSGSSYKGIKFVAGTNVTITKGDDSVNGAAVLTINAAGGGGGGLTSVGLSMPSGFSVANSPLIANGTLAVSLVSQTSRKVLASPAGSSGVPTFRNLVVADIPDLSASYDKYEGFNLQVDSNIAALIPSKNTSQVGTYFGGIKFISGSGITITGGSTIGNQMSLEIAATGGGGGGITNTIDEVALTANGSNISAGAWTDVISYTINADGEYYLPWQLTAVKTTTTGAIVAARIVTAGIPGQVLSSAEQYATSVATNRVALAGSGRVTVKGGGSVTVKLQLYASTTGWSAVRFTPTSGSSDNATQFQVIKIA